MVVLAGLASLNTHINIKGGCIVLPPFFFLIFLGEHPYTVPFHLLDQLPLFSCVDLVIHDQDNGSCFQSNFSLVVVQS